MCHSTGCVFEDRVGNVFDGLNTKYDPSRRIVDMQLHLIVKKPSLKKSLITLCQNFLPKFPKYSLRSSLLPSLLEESKINHAILSREKEGALEICLHQIWAGPWALIQLTNYKKLWYSKCANFLRNIFCQNEKFAIF